MDFINKGMLFAAVLLLCFFPFIIVANAFAGQSAVTGLVRHLGLNQQAAKDVSGLFASSSATSNAVTGTAYLFFILGGIAAASGVQDLYERSFELKAGGLKDVAAVRMARGDRWLCLPCCGGRALVAQCSRFVARCNFGVCRTDPLLVGDDVVPALGEGVVARPAAIRRGNSAFLGGNGGGVLIYFSGTVISHDKSTVRSELCSPSCPG